ncbi:MAG: hypothetical protein ACRDCW_18235, partial [Sarcina sp.]
NLIEDKLELPKGEDLQNGATDIEQIKNDFQEVMSGSSVEMNLTNGVLKAVITEKEDHPFADADENAIANYTDWTLDNMKGDIKILDITVNRPSSSVRGKLDMSEMLTDNGRYFDLFYIEENIVD